MVLRNQRGQSLIEYVILVALVACACIGLVRTLQKTVRVNLANVIHTLQSDGHGGKHESHERITSEDVKKADFSDFMNGAANSKE